MMLGATLGDLEQLNATLVRTAGDIGDVKGQSLAATRTVVSNVLQSARNAESQIQAQMAALRSTVTSAQRSTDGANWTGTNRETFHAAVVSFNAAMSRAEETTKETFSEFATNIDKMGQSLTEFSTSFGTAMDQAVSSTQSMGAAVAGQRANLDQVMNTGMSVG
jgi:hypothetical protein